MSERYTTQPFKRPDQLSQDDLRHIDRLTAREGVLSPSIVQTLSYLEMGGDALLIHDARGLLVVLVTYGVVLSLNGNVGVVTGVFYDFNHSVVQHKEEIAGLIRKHFDSLGIEHHVTVDPPVRPAQHRSGMSEIKRAERLDGPFPPTSEADDEGPPTTQLRVHRPERTG